MRPLRVLHLASFAGNIGDQANHAGARQQLRQNVSVPLVFTELEIRQYYRGRKFDADFVALANAHDLLMIGGGNYFELWVEHSATGTTIDITAEDWANIRCPVFFHALGVDVGNGVSAATLAKFRAFLDRVLAQPKHLLSVRNDGSLQTLRTHVGDTYAARALVIPDGGFFFAPTAVPHPERTDGRRALAINLAGDMLERRFAAGAGRLSYDAFRTSFSTLLARVLDRHSDLDLVFVPHIHKDLRTTADMLAELPDSISRARTTVAPYLNAPDAANHIVDLYRGCDVVLANRFHANVCAIAVGTPAVSLCNYPQIALLCGELQLDDQLVQIDQLGFEAALEHQIESALADPARIRQRYAAVMAGLDAQAKMAHAQVDRWLRDAVAARVQP